MLDSFEVDIQEIVRKERKVPEGGIFGNDWRTLEVKRNQQVDKCGRSGFT